ncbi:MAG TPA: FprA family A-type flavoprotein [Spirochaetes bacterium]|nr:FprA family A-type flavoprotein [Spirochaetota bacterium]
MNAIEMSEGIYRIGANIKNGDLFEGMWPIPDGVSLNVYIVKGEKTAMIDLVRDWDNAPSVILGQLSSISLAVEDFDYLILNHLEPDHTGWLLGFFDRNPNVQFITTKKGAEVLKGFFGIEDNVRVIKSGDTLDLGAGKVLLFVEAPNVHWPETMVTYEKSAGILFSCDAFGAYGCVGEAIFDNQISDEEHAFFDRESLRYYANIISSFSAFVLKAIDKIEDLKINMIAPSHGIIWRENPATIIEKYRKYARYYKGPAEPEITVIWGSMYGYTQSVLNSVIQGIRSEKVPVHVHQVPNEDVSWALASAWKSAGLVFGMPTYEYKMFPPISAVIDMFERKHVQNKKVFRFGSYGWSGGAQKEFKTRTEKLNWEFLEPVEWQGRAGEEIHKLASERGKDLARQVKAMTA